jgi:D-alanyl-D-alanine carboxypeptidase
LRINVSTFYARLLLTAAILLPIPLHIVSAREPGPLFSPETTEQLNAKIRMALTAHNLPSVAVEVDVPARGRYQFVAGYADLTNKTPRQLNQPFRIASITKPFVATAILQLIDQDRLQKSDTMATWYADFPNAKVITVDDLMRMRSGIAAPSDEEVIDAIYDNPTAPAPTLQTMLNQSRALAADFISPDQKGVYTNLNYDILGGIAYQVAGKTIGNLITHQIIRPLHMRHTSYPVKNDSLPGGLHGYGLDPSTGNFVDKTLFNPALAGPAGAMISTVSDLTTFARAACAGGLLTPETQAARLQGQPLAGTSTDYGEGLAVNPNVCGHSGTIPGFNTDMYYLRDVDATIVINVNRLDRDDKPQTTPILQEVFDTVTKQLAH